MGPSDWQKYRNRQDITIAQMERLQDMTGGGSGIGPNRTYRTTRVSFENQETEPNISISAANEYYLPNNAYNIDEDRKSTRLNSSHVAISYAVFCLKKKKHA